MDFDHTVANDLSGWFRCPNEMASWVSACFSGVARTDPDRIGGVTRAAVIAKACRGGHFNASSIAGEPVQDRALISDGTLGVLEPRSRPGAGFDVRRGLPRSGDAWCKYDRATVTDPERHDLRVPLLLHKELLRTGTNLP